ncbi:hypothetical protein [Haliangium sp. UPWRP_2]|uniref:hypothetical protein n=1 Tax=Haliangium sp. UPWRP_2 TaxID=1931276 RepID=UPI000D0D2730|nr:hypothetical protein [Haliangium sp. UPWRP_2]PSM32342.1 hypothetical protein BVG81_000845 [Haliangium sp. UPWRP_2]
MHKSHLECIDQANACKSGIDQYEKTFEKMAREIGPESDSEKLKVKQVINYLEQTTDAMEKHYLDISASIRLDIGTAIDKSGRERYSIEAQIAKHRLLQSPEKTAYYMAAKSLRVLQGLQRGLRAGLEPVGGAGRDAVELARHDRERLDKSFAVALNTLSQAKAVPAPTQPPSKLSDSSQLCQLVGTLEQAQLAELQRSLASLADDLARLPTQQSTVTVGAHQ